MKGECSSGLEEEETSRRNVMSKMFDVIILPFSVLVRLKQEYFVLILGATFPEGY